MTERKKFILGAIGMPLGLVAMIGPMIWVTDSQLGQSLPDWAKFAIGGWWALPAVMLLGGVAAITPAYPRAFPPTDKKDE